MELLSGLPLCVHWLCSLLKLYLCTIVSCEETSKASNSLTRIILWVQKMVMSLQVTSFSLHWLLVQNAAHKLFSFLCLVSGSNHNHLSDLICIYVLEACAYHQIFIFIFKIRKQSTGHLVTFICLPGCIYLEFAEYFSFSFFYQQE